MRGKLSIFCVGLGMSLLLATSPAWSQTPSTSSAQDLDLSPEIIEKSPVLQRWRRQIPNVLEEIQNEPSFRTKVRLGYSQFPSTGQAGGINFGVEDVFIGRSGFTVSADYQAAFNGKREAYGANLYYYLRPLGSYVNFAPLLGYRYLRSNDYSTNGVNLGLKVLLVLSRGGAADISLTQSWLSAGSEEEAGLTTLSAGYAFTPHMRFSTDIQLQNSRQKQDSRVGLVLEWML
ncbi:MAG: hypothetical protein N2235_12675 [Fischerella sp.]|nr:hypothetical protein [Fischerella sp.]